MNPARPFPWREAMGFAFAVLRLPPEAFWAMTPRELAAAIRFAGGGQVTPPRRGDFDRLMAAFPDDLAEMRTHDGQH